MKRGNRINVGILIIIIILTIKDIMIKYDMLEKLNFNVDRKMLFSNFYIDIIILLITIVLYRFIINGNLKNEELEEEN